MPTYYKDDDTPVVQFDPQLEIAPFVLFRRLREGRAPLLVDVRSEPTRISLEGALRTPDPDWQPDEDAEIVLFDDTGDEAVRSAQKLQAAGFSGVKALFGGLQLYEFALDPRALGQHTFLIPLATEA